MNRAEALLVDAIALLDGVPLDAMPKDWNREVGTLKERAENTITQDIIRDSRTASVSKAPSARALETAREKFPVRVNVSWPNGRCRCDLSQPSGRLVACVLHEDIARALDAETERCAEIADSWRCAGHEHECGCALCGVAHGISRAICEGRP